MVPVAVSSLAALKILQTEAPQQAKSTRQEPSSSARPLDPRSTYSLSAQSLDALLLLRAELRWDHVHESQNRQSIGRNSSVEPFGRSSDLAGAQFEKQEKAWFFDSWSESVERIKATSNFSSDSQLVPWNSPDVVQQLKDWDAHSANQSARERKFRESTTAIQKSMADTPAGEAAQLRAMGATMWYERTQTFDRISDQDFFRDIKNIALYDVDLLSPINPSSELSQAFMSGKAQIIRGSKVPELQMKRTDYVMYEFDTGTKKYENIGELGFSSINKEKLESFAKENPNMHVSYIWADGDVAIILYPKAAKATPAST